MSHKWKDPNLEKQEYGEVFISFPMTKNKDIEVDDFDKICTCAHAKGQEEVDLGPMFSVLVQEDLCLI